MQPKLRQSAKLRRQIRVKLPSDEEESESESSELDCGFLLAVTGVTCLAFTGIFALAVVGTGCEKQTNARLNAILNNAKEMQPVLISQRQMLHPQIYSTLQSPAKYLSMTEIKSCHNCCNFGI